MRAIRSLPISTFALAALLALASAAAEGQDAQEPPPLPDDLASASRVYRADGASATLDDVLAAARAADVLFLGETHTDRLGHALQLNLFELLVERAAPDVQAKRPVVLSLEMFETDVQYILDEYLAGLIREDHFLNGSRPWQHYATDYRPLVELARERGLPVVAANAPRRYVNRVTREGPASLARLPAQAKAFLPPLPYEGPSPAYRAELQAVFSSHGEGRSSDAPEHGVYAQALWDAGMAWSLASALQARPGALIVHLVGSFHVRNGTGTPEQLERYRPGTRTVTVIAEPVRNVRAFPLELVGAGDFIVLTDSMWTRPSPRPGS